MKPLFVLPDDYYAACIHRLEETRGHILSEDEYRALRKETLDELATCTRTRGAVASGMGTAVTGIISGFILLFFPAVNAGWLFALTGALAASFISILIRTRRRNAAPTWTASQRLHMLNLLREHSLVTPEEFSQISERIEYAQAA